VPPTFLLYDADLVPLGEDQKQAPELARNIAQQRVKPPALRQPISPSEGARSRCPRRGLPGVDEPRRMTQQKSQEGDPNEGSRLNLLDPPELITKKNQKRAKVDRPGHGAGVRQS